MVCVDTCSHVKRVRVMALTVEYFFFWQRAWSSSGGGRLVGSSIVMFDMLLLRRGSRACSRERDHMLRAQGPTRLPSLNLGLGSSVVAHCSLDSRMQCMQSD